MPIPEFTAWAKVPPKYITACQGDNVTFDWTYDDVIHNVTDGVLITKGATGTGNAEDILRRTTDRDMPDVKDVEGYSNAGMLMFNVSDSQSGVYESTVYFPNDPQIHHAVNLSVLGSKFSPTVEFKQRLS